MSRKHQKGRKAGPNNKTPRSIWANNNELPQMDLYQLRDRCFASMESFRPLGEAVETRDGFYTFIDNGADVLAVAHLDTVQAANTFAFYQRGATLPDDLAEETYAHFEEVREDGVSVWRSKSTGKSTSVGAARVYNPKLDDRLGVYAILDYLPLLVGTGKYDILLTEGEESGRSTAQYFQPPQGKEYRWMFSFDRAGEDVVMYQFDSPENRKRLTKHDFAPAHGSFSDIAYLDHLKVSGFNFGTGYYDNHSLKAYFVVEEFLRQALRFQSFFRVYAPKTLEAPPDTSYRSRNRVYVYGGKGYSSWNDDSAEYDKWWYERGGSTRRSGTYDAFKTCSTCGVDYKTSSFPNGGDVCGFCARTGVCAGCGSANKTLTNGLCRLCREIVIEERIGPAVFLEENECYLCANRALVNQDGLCGACYARLRESPAILEDDFALADLLARNQHYDQCGVCGVRGWVNHYGMCESCFETLMNDYADRTGDVNAAVARLASAADALNGALSRKVCKDCGDPHKRLYSHGRCWECWNQMDKCFACELRSELNDEGLCKACEDYYQSFARGGGAG